MTAEVVFLGEGEIGIALPAADARILARILTDYRTRVVPMSRAQLIVAGVDPDLVERVASVDGYVAETWTELALELFDATALADPSTSTFVERQLAAVPSEPPC